MGLKFQLETLEGVDTNIAPMYSQGDDGKFYLDVEGVVAKSKLDEFRSTNIDLLKKLDAFKDVNPAEYKKLKKEIEDAKKRDENKPDLDKLVEERTRQMREEMQTELDNAKSTNLSLQSQLSMLLIDSAVKDAAVKSAALPSAIDDLLLRARNGFTVENGLAIMKDANGHTVYDKDGSTPMSIDSWVKSLKKSAPHLFNMPTGGGSQGGGRGGLDTSKMSAMHKIAAGLTERSM